MIFTIEPMINAGKRDVKLLPDHWTVVTKDHSLSAQWEHTILVTEDGYEVLTNAWRGKSNLLCQSFKLILRYIVYDIYNYP